MSEPRASSNREAVECRASSDDQKRVAASCTERPPLIVNGEKVATGTYNVLAADDGRVLGWVLRRGNGKWIACSIGIGRINGKEYATRNLAMAAVSDYRQIRGA